MSTLSMVHGFFESNSNVRKSREKILNIQEKKFRKILRYAYKNSKFYHDLYTSAGINKDDLSTVSIEKIPIVNKEIIMNNFDEVVTTNDLNKEEIMDFIDVNRNPSDLFKGKYFVIHSSGGSGKVGVTVYNKRDYDYSYPFITRAYKLKFKRIKPVLYGAVDGHYSIVSFTLHGKKGITKFFSKPLVLDINNPLDKVVKKLNDFRPDILGGYFTGLKVLAKQQEKGSLKINPSYIVSCGEAVLKKDKEYIESVFEKSLINLYGLAESNLVGIGKNEFNGIYLNDDLVFLEIKEDHLLLTNLFNKTMPLIRYRVDDILKKKNDVKKILPFTLIDEVLGRAEQMIWLRNKEGGLDFIHPIVIAEFYVKGLDKLQIIVKTETSFDFLAVITGDKQTVVKNIKENMDRILNEKDFTTVKYNIITVDDIPVDSKTGKYKLVVKKH